LAKIIDIFEIAATEVVKEEDWVEVRFAVRSKCVVLGISYYGGCPSLGGICLPGD